MKKIKLLTPILTLSALALPVATLTSCDKEVGRVTKEEWNKAFEYLCNRNYKSAWKASDGDCVWSMYKQEAEGITTTRNTFYRDINIKQDILNLDVIDYYDETGKSHQWSYKDMQGVIINNYSFEFTYKVDKSIEKTDCSIQTTSTFQSLITTIFEQYIDFENFTYENGSYIGSYSVQQEIIPGGVITGELSSKITFNNDKRIGFIDTFIFMASDPIENDGAEACQIYELTLHPQYSNIDASIHDDYLEWTREHIEDMRQNTSVTKKVSDTSGFITNIKNHQYNKISVKKNESTKLTNAVESIYKNGKLLEEGKNKDYYYDEADNSTIIFTTPITAQDRVSALIKTNKDLSAGDEVTVSIIQE